MRSRYSDSESIDSLFFACCRLLLNNKTRPSSTIATPAMLPTVAPTIVGIFDFDAGVGVGVAVWVAPSAVGEGGLDGEPLGIRQQ